MFTSTLLEISLDSVKSAVAAERGGAQRVELCDNLDAGGTTPNRETIELARKKITVGLHVMIRPRPGDFCYSESEFDSMKKDIAAVKKLGVDGVVFGILKKDRTVDTERTKILIDLAKPMSTTFHRAFDVASDPVRALEDIISAGCYRLLTSGQQPTAEEGLPLIAKLIELAGKRIVIMPGCAINAQNAKVILEKTGATEIHIGTAATSHVGSRHVVDEQKVKMFMQILSCRR
ncbi:MAG TPA: copper homeostasis protein CutC [Bacteroidota bacterium]|nr:copper homeostasis protein CutC [Bacteroidota bacterium]